MFRYQLLDHSKIINGWSVAVTVLQRKASMQKNAFLLVPAIKGCIYVSTHFLTSQPTLIKLDNENIGGHCYTFTHALNRLLAQLTSTLARHEPRLGQLDTSNQARSLPSLTDWGVVGSRSIVVLWYSSLLHGELSTRDVVVWMST